MARGRWHRRSKASGARPPAAVALLGATLLLGIFFSRQARAGEVAILPSSEGYLGAWLALGPLYSDGKSSPRTLDARFLPEGDEATLAGHLGRSVQLNDGGEKAPPAASWRVLGASGAIDLLAELAPKRSDAFSYLYGVLHLTQPLRGMLLLGASDGVRVWIDQKQVWSNDASRAEHDDEDIVRIELTAGDHPILMKLHHHEGYWAVRARVADTTFAAPRGAFLKLPGTTDADARSLAQRMTDLHLAYGLGSAGFRPTVTAAFPDGLPRGIDRTLRVSATARSGAQTTPFFSIDAGQVPLNPAGPGAFKVRLPAIGQGDLREFESDGTMLLQAQVAGRTLESEVPVRPYLYRSMAAAERALALVDSQDGFLQEPAVTRATLEHLRDRLALYVDSGPQADREVLAKDAQELFDFEADLRARRDPLRVHPKIRRFAYRSLLDGELSPFGVYVPEGFVRAPTLAKTYPLVVVLHGMNGKPLSMLSWFFGNDDDSHEAEWEDRRPGDGAPVDGFVVSPNGYGNAMYRELGEVDVMNVIAFVMRFFPIDKNRVTITGPSMGGTGTAAIAFHHPDLFAAAEPLCGYHSYFIRHEFMRPASLRPWERVLAEQRSNALWAENGLYLPLYVWHGKRDWPEKNSGVLIERYESLGYDIEHEHPDVGHDVWRKAYHDAGAFTWLAQKSRALHKRRILFKTDSPRYLDDAWVHLRDVSADLEFATVDAQIAETTLIEVKTQRVDALSLDRDPALVSLADPTRVRVDGTVLTFEAGEPIDLYREGGSWKRGKKEPSGPGKRAGLSGPMRDVFFEPLILVYGTQDAGQTRPNRETAQALSRIRWGVDARYPIIADSELTDELAESHSLVLVGNPASNSIVRGLEPKLPFRVTARAVSAVVNGQRKKTWTGNDLGVAFVYPNPDHPSRYVLVVEGTNALGTFRAMALPDLLPDYMVFDQRIAPARGQIGLGDATPLWGGFFRNDWSFRPADFAR